MAEGGFMPVVSVVMPVYNSERYVARAVESILCQTFGDFEFIIIDDGSTDDSGGILEDFAVKDRRIRLVRRANTGYAVALNEGLGMARGEFVARMDSDDVSRPERFARQVEFLRAKPEVVAVGGQVVVIDPDGDAMWPMDHCPTGHEAIDADHINGVGGRIMHPAAMFRRYSLERVGGYRTEFEPAEDLDLFLRLAEVGRLANVESIVLEYRVHLRSVSLTRAREQTISVNKTTAEARARRGMTPAATVEVRDFEGLREEKILESWARRAYRRGDYAMARKHALRAIQLDCASAASWRLLAGSCLGRSSRPLHWLYRRMKGLSP